MNKAISQNQSLSSEAETENDLENLIGYNLKRAYVHVQTDFREVLGNDGFAPRVFAALAVVIQHPNISQSDLSRRLGIERSGLVAIVDDLEKRELLKRTKVHGDRRVQALVPTALGQEVYDSALKAVKAHETRMFNMFTTQEKGQLLSLLRKLRMAVEGKD